MMKKAFTLIELAIVLIIIGLLVGGGFKTMQILSKRAKRTETKQKLAAAKEAVIGYAQTHGYLPNSSEFSTLIGSDSDSWGKPLFYAADTNLVNNDICAYDSTNLKIGGDFSVIDTAFVIASGGENYNMQTGLHNDTVKIYNPDKQNIDDNSSDFNRPERYDDLSEWVTLPVLKQQIRCSDHPLRIVNSSLPSTDENSSYDVPIVIDGNYTVPSTFNCSIDSAYNTYFTFDTNNYHIKNSTQNRPSGVAVIHCNVTVGDDNVSKTFTITINP